MSFRFLFIRLGSDSQSPRSVKEENCNRLRKQIKEFLTFFLQKKPLPLAAVHVMGTMDMKTKALRQEASMLLENKELLLCIEIMTAIHSVGCCTIICSVL